MLNTTNNLVQVHLMGNIAKNLRTLTFGFIGVRA